MYYSETNRRVDGPELRANHYDLKVGESERHIP